MFTLHLFDQLADRKDVFENVTRVFTANARVLYLRTRTTGGEHESCKSTGSPKSLLEKICELSVLLKI